MSLNFVSSCRLLYLNGVISDQDAMECVSHVADLATKAPHVQKIKQQQQFLLHTDALGLDTDVGGCLPLLSGFSDVWIDG